MNLAELKSLVKNAEYQAAIHGETDDQVEVYVILKSGSIKDIESWSPRDFNRGGVALITR